MRRTVLLTAVVFGAGSVGHRRSTEIAFAIWLSLTDGEEWIQTATASPF